MIELIAMCVEDIWRDFDSDNSGTLDEEQAKRFIRHVLMMDGLTFGEDDVEELMRVLDLDETRIIKKDEMIHFIKKISRL